MKKKLVVFSLLFLFAMGAITQVHAGRDHMDVGMMYDEPVYYSTVLTADASLNLTAEQVLRIRDLDEKYAQEIKSIQAQLYSKGKALKSEWLQARPNRDKITAHQCDVINLRNQMQEKMTNHRTEVLQVLNPEQQAHVQDDRHGHGFYKQAGFGRQ